MNNVFKMSKQHTPENPSDGNEKQPDCTWEVKANDRHYHKKFKKGFLFFKRKKYADNAIKTSKYNVLTFIPLNLFEQFHQACNLYFLFCLILQTFPDIASIPWFIILIPLVVLLLIKGIKDLSDDITRHRSDASINNRPCEILRDKSFCKKKWKDIQVGDIVRLWNDDFVPADLLLLYSSEPNSLCYVETADIDGETNLKFRQALMATHEGLSTLPAQASFDGKVICEEPNSSMHTFIGILEWRGEKYPLDNEKLLLRGCRIRNTKTCYGMVIYAGFDSKIMKNCGKINQKKTKLDVMINKLVIIIFAILVSCSFCLAVAAGFWTSWFQENHTYVPALPVRYTPAYSGFLLFWGYFILMSTIVPMSLFMTSEFIHVIHSLFIDWDLQMYYAEKDIPAKARSTSLSDLLGQIEYVFSDKTGTLTQNIMVFKKCCISKRIYGTSSADEKESQRVDFSWNQFADKKLQFYDQSLIDGVRGHDTELQEFFRLLAICHTVMVEEKEGDLIYQAASPDEGALVTAARNFGYVFLSRTQDTVTVSELGVERTYKVLAILDFNSVRKRMSILVRTPEGTVKLYTKGADLVIFERLHSSYSNDTITKKALDEVDELTFSEWNKKHHEARTSLQNRAEKLDAVYELIEGDLQLLGATGIEDKLQDGVPETIQLLKKANIKVWVLTGDKQETAVNIAFSCKLLTDDMEILNETEVCDMLDAYWENNNNRTGSVENLLASTAFRKHRESLHCGKMALVITGEYLGKILGNMDKKKLSSRMLRGICCKHETEMEEEVDGLREKAFVDLACLCQAVVFCRVTPKQKAMVVQLLRRHKNVTTLAIGDGANDVNMIKTAHIGIGINGQEGTQAVQTSDYALAQFRYLQPLLLVHGRWSYFRICKFLRYFFYKTAASVLIQIWFAIFNGFTAVNIYDNWFIAFFAVFYTSLPVLAMGLQEQDVSAKVSLQSPELYKMGQTGSLFTYRTFFVSFLNGATTSLAVFFVTFGAFFDTATPDYPCDSFSLAAIVATAIVLAVTVQIILETSYWTVWSGLAIIISLVMYFILSFVFQLSQLFIIQPKVFRFPDANRNSLDKVYTWAIILLAVVLSNIPILFTKISMKLTVDNRAQKKHFYRDTTVAENTVELKSHFKRNSTLRRSSYAFSHQEGYANLITRGTSIRKKSKIATTLEASGEEEGPTDAQSVSQK
ncbi:phospholipid-transporting ATPase IK isoform X2 [Microcaecilia unicolor]|uniref:Phospholipid-transporting ATPase n=1 Tax=Microcaecilia unicolor TaxID=1415580 RepID=A0A6P7ZD81_9AMPH|nr:phospholipid-transporting ATPase IK isoform X2 [Microcaecilia unicolor]